MTHTPYFVRLKATFTFSIYDRVSASALLTWGWVVLWGAVLGTVGDREASMAPSLS